MARIGWGALVLAACAGDVTKATSRPSTLDPDGTAPPDPAPTSPPTSTTTTPSVGDSGAPAESGDTGTPGDTDGDTVADASDRCPGEDDRVDLDGDAVPDCAQNLLANGQFTSDLSPWVPATVGSNTSTAAFDPADASGWVGSGSAAVVNTSRADTANAAGLTSGCVPATPGAFYDVFYRYRLDPGAPAGPAPVFVTSFMTYRDRACTVAAASATPGSPATVVGPWTVVALPAIVQMQPDWNSFEIQIALYKPGSTDPVPFSLDDALVRETP